MSGTLGSNQLKTLWKLDNRHKLLTSINDQKSVGGRNTGCISSLPKCVKSRRNLALHINNHTTHFYNVLSPNPQKLHLGIWKGKFITAN